MTDNLPAKNADGFITLSDFYSHHREPIESALKNAQIPHQIVTLGGRFKKLAVFLRKPKL